MALPHFATGADRVRFVDILEIYSSAINDAFRAPLAGGLSHVGGQHRNKGFNARRTFELVVFDSVDFLHRINGSIVSRASDSISDSLATLDCRFDV